MSVENKDLKEEYEEMKTEYGHLSSLTGQVDDIKDSLEDSLKGTTETNNNHLTSLETLLRQEIDKHKSSVTIFQKETKIISRTLAQLQDSLEQEQANSADLQTELRELKESFSEKMPATQADLDRKTRGIAEELKQQKIRSENLQTELHSLNARFIKQSDTTKAEYDRQLREVANAGETMLQTETKILSQALVQLQDELNQERTRSTELQTQLQKLKGSFSEQFKTTKADYDRKIREVANAGESMVQTAKDRLQKRLEEQQEKVNINLQNTFNKDSGLLLGIGIITWLAVLTAVFAIYLCQGQN